MTRTRRAAIVLLVYLLAVPPALAHVPADPGDNTAPKRALVVEDAAKSWSFYDEIDDGRAQYYRVTVDEGERLLVGTFTPVDGAFAPALVVMSDSIAGRDDVPSEVTVPDGWGAVVVPGSRPGRASYEPFAPSANYHTAEYERATDGATTYLIAVYEPAGLSGPAGVVVGYEEAFTPVEYARVPFDLLEVHLWAGQHPLVVFGPLVATLLVGALAVRSRWRRSATGRRRRIALTGAGLLVLASGANALVQMALALAETGPAAGALVTALFVLVPALAGGWAVALATRGAPSLARRERVGLLLAGVAALGTWAGFLVGPAVLAAVGLVGGPRRSN